MAEVEILIACDEYGLNIEAVQAPQPVYQKTNVFYLDGPNFTIGEPLQVKSPPLPQATNRKKKPIRNNRTCSIVKEPKLKSEVKSTKPKKKREAMCIDTSKHLKIGRKQPMIEYSKILQKYCTDLDSCPLCESQIPISYLRVSSLNNDKINIICPACSKDLTEHVLCRRQTLLKNSKIRKDFVVEFSLRADENVEKVTWTRKNLFCRYSHKIDEDTTQVCEFCQKRVTQRYMPRHIRDSHQLLLCEICGKTVPIRSLYRHRVRHQDKKFKCTKCDFKCHFKKSLSKHQMVHNKDESRMYPCKFCGHFLTSRWNLQQHLRIHTKVTPYRCVLCNEDFRYNCSLKRHIIMNHPGKSIQESMSRITDTRLCVENESIDRNDGENGKKNEEEGNENEDEDKGVNEDSGNEDCEENRDNSGSDEASDDFDAS